MPQVTIVPTGESFAADPGEPVLTAALRAGLNLPHSCKGGHCASCRARLLSGATTYPTRELPAGITPDEAAERFVLLCQAQAITDITIETREMRPAPEVEVKSLPSRIDRMERLADDVMAVFLKLPAVEDLHYRAGQYIDFILSGGRRRSFSLASAPADGKMLEVHVRRASSSGFTGQLFDTMRAGTLLRVEGPLGQFWFRGDSPRHAVMIGGGTGYAPLRAMLRQLLAVGDRRPLTLYWGARTTQDLYEHNWLVERRGHPSGLRLPAGAVRAAGRRIAMDGSQRVRARSGACRSRRRPDEVRRLRERSAGDGGGDPPHVRRARAAARAAVLRLVRLRARYAGGDAEDGRPSSARRDAAADTGIRRVPEGRRATWTSRASLQGRIHGVPSGTLRISGVAGSRRIRAHWRCPTTAAASVRAVTPVDGPRSARRCHAARCARARLHPAGRAVRRRAGCSRPTVCGRATPRDSCATCR